MAKFSLGIRFRFNPTLAGDDLLKIEIIYVNTLRHGNPYEAYDNYEKHQENESKRIHLDRIGLKENVEELKDLLLLNHDHGIRGFV
nr:hypothetical protein CFP56_74108 [Quercus suber]